MQIAKQVALDDYLAKWVGMPEEGASSEDTHPQIDLEFEASMKRKRKLR